MYSNILALLVLSYSECSDVSSQHAYRMRTASQLAVSYYPQALSDGMKSEGVPQILDPLDDE